MNKVLTQGLSTILRRRRAKQHFERLPLLESLTAAPVAALPEGCGVTAAGGQELLAAAQGRPAQALALPKSQVDGLDGAEAARRLDRDGPNDVQHEAPLPRWLRLWRCHLNPFNLLLTALALLSFFSADSKATVVIGVMVALSTGIRFVQEGRSHRAADGLRATVKNTATVIRRASTASSVPVLPSEAQGTAFKGLIGAP